jgi:CBS domain-containing protein
MTEPSAQNVPGSGTATQATIADIMRPPLTTVEEDAHIAAAAYLMRHAGDTALVVLHDEQDKQPRGLVTEADIVRAVADGKDVNDVRIRDIMTSDLTVSAASTSLRDAAESMLASRFRHLLVVDDGRLVGMVDIGAVCGALLATPGG